MRIGRAAQNLTISSRKLLLEFIQLYDLSGTNEGEIQWVKEQQKILSFEVSQTNLLKLFGRSFEDLSLEKRSNFSHQSLHYNLNYISYYNASDKEVDQEVFVH